MSGFLFALVGVVLTSIGARDQRLIAGLAAQGGQSAPLLIIGWISAIVSAIVMAWSGQAVAALLPSAAKTMLVAIAMVFAAIELLRPVREVSAAEPTRSLGAIAIVLAARQLGDAARFLIFAFAAATGTPWLAAIGGAAGGMIAVTAAWVMAGDFENAMPYRIIRLALGGIVMVLAIVVALTARGLI